MQHRSAAYHRAEAARAHEQKEAFRQRQLFASIGGNGPMPSYDLNFFDKGADVREGPARDDPETLVSGAVRDPDAKAEAAARDFVQVGGAVREIPGGADIDRRDRGAEREIFGGERQRRALRHIAEPARD